MKNILNNTIYTLQFVHENDSKVLALPQALRDILPDKVRLTRSISRKHCLHLFTEYEWEVFQSKLKALPQDNIQVRKLMEFYIGIEYEADIRDGFLHIPQNLLDYIAVDDSVRAVYVSRIPEETEHHYSNYLLWTN